MIVKPHSLVLKNLQAKHDPCSTLPMLECQEAAPDPDLTPPEPNPIHLMQQKNKNDIPNPTAAPIANPLTSELVMMKLEEKFWEDLGVSIHR